MDDRHIGRVFRAVRLRRALRQEDVAETAGVDQSVISTIERGLLDEVSLPTLRAVAHSLEVRLAFEARWHGPDLQRLLDADHASLVDVFVRLLQTDEWGTVLEYGFNHFGDRGSVDVLAWHPSCRTLLIVEVKTRIVDLQDLFSTLERKARVVPALAARDRDWRAANVGRLLVVLESSTNRGLVSRHAASFDATLPATGWEVRRWLQRPDRPLAGVLFLQLMGDRHATRGQGQILRLHRGSRAAERPNPAPAERGMHRDRPRQARSRP